MVPTAKCLPKAWEFPKTSEVFGAAPPWRRGSRYDTSSVNTEVDDCNAEAAADEDVGYASNGKPKFNRNTATVEHCGRGARETRRTKQGRNGSGNGTWEKTKHPN